MNLRTVVATRYITHCAKAGRFLQLSKPMMTALPEADVKMAELLTPDILPDIGSRVIAKTSGDDPGDLRRRGRRGTDREALAKGAISLARGSTKFDYSDLAGAYGLL